MPGQPLRRVRLFAAASRAHPDVGSSSATRSHAVAAREIQAERFARQTEIEPRCDETRVGIDGTRGGIERLSAIAVTRS